MIRGDTPFNDLALLCRELEQTTKRNDKVAKMVAFLKKLRQDEIAPAVRMIVGKIFPDYDETSLDVSGRTLWKVLHTQRGRQTRLLQEPLTILEVYRRFREMAAASGRRSRAKKESMVQSLLSEASLVEAEYLVRMLYREMRIGVVEGVMLDAIAKAGDVPADLVRRSLMMLGDIGEVARLALTGGRNALEEVKISLFRPVRLMMAETSDDVSEILRENRSRVAFEFKFDGARIQAHKKGDEVRIFSRRLTDVTQSLPDIVDTIRKNIKADEALVEGEVVATGPDMKPLPFQELMRRFRRAHEVDRAAQGIPLRLYLFDVLYLDGRQLIDLEYQERWRLLSQICPPGLLAERIVTDDLHEINDFLHRAISAGHEGLMAKALDSTYLLGARGRRWLKLKLADKLDLVIVAADWGYGRRSGWLSNYHLAARDESTGELLEVGKTFKGLTDDEFEWMTRRLQELKVSENENTVWVRPQLVVEVAYNEIQRSPHYKSGLALRFARITRIREDKRPEDADTLERLRATFERQFEYKGRLK